MIISKGKDPFGECKPINIIEKEKKVIKNSTFLQLNLLRNYLKITSVYLKI